MNRLASRGIVVGLAALMLVVSTARVAAASSPAPAQPAPAQSATVSASPAQDFSADIAAAKDLWRKGRTREAIALLAADYKQDPTNRDVTVAYAQAYSYSGDQGRAISLLDKLLAATPDDVDARIVLAQAYSYNHDYASAETQYQKVLATAPNDSDAQVGLAQTYTFEGRFEDARKLYAAVLKRDPKNSDALVGLAGAEAFQGDYRKARTDYRTVLDAQPDNTDALVGLATVEYWLNNIPAAIALTNRALALDPADSDARDLRRQLNIKTSPQIISTVTTSNSTDGQTQDYRLSERFFAAPTTSFGLVQEVYRISDSSASVQTHKIGVVATYQQSSSLAVDLSILASKYGGVPGVTDTILNLSGANNGIGYGLGISTGGVDGSVVANGGRLSPDQASALVRITSLFGNVSYTRRASTLTFAADGAAYNDGNRFHDYSIDASHQFGIGALMTITPDIKLRDAGFSNTYNTPAQALSPGYYNYSSQRDISLITTAQRQFSDRFSAGLIATLGSQTTKLPIYHCISPNTYTQCSVFYTFETPGTLTFQRFEPFLDYEGDRFSLAGALYLDDFPGRTIPSVFASQDQTAVTVLPYHATTVDVTFSIRLP